MHECTGWTQELLGIQLVVVMRDFFHYALLIKIGNTFYHLTNNNLAKFFKLKI
jgi:hypothetical protein